MSLRRSARRFAVSLCLAGASLGAMAFGGTSAASAAYIEGGPVNVRSCAPWNLVATPCGLVGSLRNRTTVTMIKWCDAGWVNGRYGSNRWFKVSGSGITGWVHSSYVEGQYWTPYGCS